MDLLELYREKLINKIDAQYNEATKTIVFDDGTTIPGDTALTMIRPTAIPQADLSKIPAPNQSTADDKQYSFASLYFLIYAVTKAISVTVYVTTARKMGIMHLPWSEAKPTTNYMKGETAECDLLLANLQTVSQHSSKASKRQKLAELAPTVLVQLSHATTLPNTSSVLHNAPFNSFDYITMMKSIYNESHATYVDSSKRKLGDNAIQTDGASVTATLQFKPEAPIIIVPGSSTFTFSFKNLGDLFANGNYIKSTEPDDAFQIKPDVVPPNAVTSRQLNAKNFKTISRPSVSRPGATCTIEFCSDPDSLSPSQWNRVIATVVTGKSYQLDSFTPYKDSKDQIDTPTLFAEVAGIYLYFDGEKIPPTITQWNVSTHKFALSKRHQDEIVMSEVWDRIIHSAKRKSRTNPNLFF